MWWFLLGFLLGAVIFAIVGYQVAANKVNEKEKYTRRGIYTGYYENGNKKSFEVQFELGELESTSTKSKVRVLSMTASKSEFNTHLTKQKIKEMIDNTWVLSNDIEWIEDTAKVRNDKIDQILSS